MIIMTLRGARNNPLMSEGAGGAEVPKALFYEARKMGGFSRLSDRLILIDAAG